MMYLLALWAGAAIGAGAVYLAHRRWAVEHHFRRIRLETIRVDELYRTADHDHRAAQRWAGALVTFRELYDDVVGDLLDKVAELQRQVDRHRRPRHLAVARYSPQQWQYGRARAVTP